MNFLKAFAIVAIAGGFVACSDENASAVWNSAELSSSDNAVPSSSSQPVADTVWHQANLTWYTSWPEPDSEECIEYNGCTWAGYFAGIEDQMTEEWVSQHNIIALNGIGCGTCSFG